MRMLERRKRDLQIQKRRNTAMQAIQYNNTDIPTMIILNIVKDEL